MSKMKKILGSIAVTAAFSMVASVLPTVVLASNTAAITTQPTGCYNEAEGTVTVEGTISSSDADVTVLAVRSAEELTDTSFLSSEGLEGKIVYIDQVGAEDTDNYAAQNDGTANWNFTFVPKTGVTGGYITVFVGGTDVDQVQLISFSAAVAAPALTAKTWYKGDSLVMDIHKAGDSSVSYGDTDALDAWKSAIEKVIVNGNELDSSAYTVDTAEETIIFTGLESVSSIKITTVDGEYKPIDMTNLTLAPIDKPAGTIAATSASAIENDAASMTFNLTDSTLAGWLAEINARTNAAVEVDGVATDDWSYSDGVLTVNGLTVGTADEKDFSVVVKVTNYANSSAATFKSISPVKDAYDKLSVATTYKNEAVEGADPQGDLSDDEYYALWGKAEVTLPATGENGTTITWTKDDAAVSGTVALDRPAADSSDKFNSYTFKATISKGSYTSKDKTFVLKANKLGASVAIEAEMISVIKADAYGKTGYDLITIDAGDNVDPATQSIKIGDVTLFYSTTRANFVGIVVHQEIADLANSAEIVDGEAIKIVYGKGALTSNKATALNAADFGGVKRIALGKDTTPTDEQLISSDVANGRMDGRINAADFGAVKRVALHKDVDLAINIAD